MVHCVDRPAVNALQLLCWRFSYKKLCSSIF